MSKTTDKIARASAMRAAKLAAQGWSHRNIAEALGIKAEQVKARVLLGERLYSLECKR